MRSLSTSQPRRVGLVALTLIAGVGFHASDASAQQRVAAVNRPATAARAASPAETALTQAAAGNQYAFLFFYRDRSAQTDAAWATLQQAMGNFAGTASSIAVAVNDPAEKAIVARFDATRSPMPMVLAIAPNGAVTKGFPGKFDEAQLQEAFVSPATAGCLKGLQERKLVLLCVQPAAQSQATGQVLVPRGVADFAARAPVLLLVPRGVADFAADPRYGQATQIIVADPSDPNEASFLQEFQLGATTAPTVVFLAPPGSVVGQFPASVSRDQLIAKLVAAQSNPCAGGKCGPNGCGPRQ